jgi:hypothetical protein
MRAAPGRFHEPLSRPPERVEMSFDTARKSAYATLAKAAFLGSCPKTRVTEN